MVETIDQKVRALLDPEKVKRTVRELTEKWAKCKERGHPNTTYLWTTNNGGGDACYDTYQCKDCPALIKVYNHKATQEFIEALRTPCTI